MSFAEAISYQLEVVPTLSPVKIEDDVAVSEEAVQRIAEAASGVPQEQGVVGIVGEMRGDYSGETRSEGCVPWKICI